MATQGFAVFGTAIGHCGIVWDEHVVIGSQLPEGDEGRTRARVRRSFPDAVEQTPPEWVRRYVDGVQALLRGEGAPELPELPLDLSRVPPFYARVYEVARAIPVGETMTYGEIAQRLGDPGSARAVGQAMGSNPFAPIVPCHRVIAAGGGKGGFSAHGGTRTKVRILEIEGVHLEEPTLFDL
ncbi:methylated-DNA-[protein]-cysteine S-methyltransferase [Amycolatopsis endophytica]|uniref:methylated-DNA--[protein]-cysteine S-methyltransferase n=1 Tax=Amycolatopsis endophytica TaxID=860233 RepID=A0A853B4R8_9PSEU|nr:methylated-DNA--[protein]-cysteine S-methyltransferase [Amycolatopsis endophytica]NYI89797.1 methylated-DNA-[protein]-cysteine S-methyltransferase [Amycolatopsis endophytica]